jgi:hypothetical protein
VAKNRPSHEQPRPPVQPPPACGFQRWKVTWENQLPNLLIEWRFHPVLTWHVTGVFFSCQLNCLSPSKSTPLEVDHVILVKNGNSWFMDVMDDIMIIQVITRLLNTAHNGNYMYYMMLKDFKKYMKMLGS